MGNYFRLHYKNLRFVKGTETKPGLRNAQIGAIHAIASHFTLDRGKAAIVVMPTGSGKTSVLMMTPYVLESAKVLVVTPSVMVRGQIAEDFSALRTLCKATVFGGRMKKPVVHEMKNMYRDEQLDALSGADVVIATPQCALSLSSNDRIRDQFDLVLVDEAHHVPAKTWEQILMNMSDAKHVLFTATPFRLDKKEIRGDVVYAYPLSMAYKDGIFGEIEYIPIDQAPNKDYLIAKRAERVFFSDRELGYEHSLMVRTSTKEKAQELEALYSEETSLVLRRIDSSMSYGRVKECIDQLRNRTVHGIICVDMLGEGFDFPNLKIAAIHSPHKSLASTLQFIGRFARTNTAKIGTAKFIAMNDEELSIENTLLYDSDAVWQDIVIDLSETRTREEEQARVYFKGFRNAAHSNLSEDLPLSSIRINCHAKAFRATGFDINKEFPDELNVNSTLLHETDNTVVGIGKECLRPNWITSNAVLDVNNILYVVHYQRESGLLFIYSQVKTEHVYELIAEAFCDSYQRIPRYQMNRVLGNLTSFEIFNSGMQNRYAESGESYRISAGSDVASSIDPVTGQLYSPGHVFCKANSGNSDVTIGYSSGSKIWSSSCVSIPQFVRWCDLNGEKIVNTKITVKTNTNFDYLPMPSQLKQYPGDIFLCDYSAETYRLPPVVARVTEDALSDILTDIPPKIIEVKPDYITVEFNHATVRERMKCDLNGHYVSTNPQISLVDGNSVMRLVDYLNEFPLIFKTTDDVLIQGIDYMQGNPDGIVYSSDNIIGIPWDTYGTNIRVEVNDPVHHPTGISIQSTVEKLLKEDPGNRYIIYDHSSSEMADFITIQESDVKFEVTLYHVKRMSGRNYNSSVDDVYEVCGQAVKSTIWLKTKPGFIRKISERRRSGHCQFMQGSFEEFKIAMKQNKQLVGRVVIVQPAINPNIEMPDKIQRVLAASSFYINNSGRVRSLTVWGSQ